MTKLEKYLADYIKQVYGYNYIKLEENIKQGLDAFESTESVMKQYIFLTIDGQTKDGAGNDIENCQQIASVVKAESALDAYNRLLERGGFYGKFDSCFCYELADDGKIQGRFDLISDRN